MKIYNTLTKKKEEFIPINKDCVKMYTCGPTVYNYFHIGNARPFVFFDVVRRYFEFIGYSVIYVQNITDIDDKIINKANEMGTNIKEISEKYTLAFFEDCKKLGIKKADYNPKATEYIQKMIEFIQNLEKRDLAYEKNGNVYFSVDKSANYGELSGKKIEELKVGARVQENKDKKNPLDFVLWKTAKEDEPFWNSPWGKGRPGWHTECVVMAKDILGENFDIHCGGVDLVFPHHENEKAQAEALSSKKFVNYWIHNGFLKINGEKMSKSLNNFFTVRDILKKYDSQTIRFFFLSKHYSMPIDFKEDNLIQSKNALENFYSILKELNYLSFKEEVLNNNDKTDSFIEKFKNSMGNDFNTAQAIAVLFEINSGIKASKEITEKKNLAVLLVTLGKVLGFFDDLPLKLTPSKNLDILSNKLIELFIAYRNEAKKEKNWFLADKIRNNLKEIGIELRDSKEKVEFEILD